MKSDNRIQLAAGRKIQPTLYRRDLRRGGSAEFKLTSPAAAAQRRKHTIVNMFFTGERGVGRHLA